MSQKGKLNDAVGSLTITQTLPIGGDLNVVTKSYVDSAVSNSIPFSAGSGISISSRVLNVNSSQPQITSIGTLTNLTVSSKAYFLAGLDAGTAIISNVMTPINPLDASNKTYVDSVLTAINSPGIGLNRNNNILNVIPNQSQVTTLGVLTGLSVNGNVQFSNGLDAGTSNITSVAIPINLLDATNKTYVDSACSNSALAGTGLSKSNTNRFSVNPIQTQITNVGVLNSLTVVNKSYFQSGLDCGTNVITSVSNPVNLLDAANKIYVDNNVLTGNGIVQSGKTFSVNPNLVLTSISTNIVNTANAQYLIPNSGNTVVSNGNSLLILDPSGTLASLTIVFPTGIDGKTLKLISSQNITNLSLTATFATNSAINSLTGGSSVNYTFISASNSWWKL